MNYKNLAVGMFALGSTFLSTSEVLAATRIQFAKGSYCGSYSGNFQAGRNFVLGLAQGQTFTFRNIGSGLQYNITVSGPTGEIYGSNVSEQQINYQIPARGDYYVYVQSDTTPSSVEFCAY